MAPSCAPSTVAKPRQTKWDWPTHFPRMDKLYREGKSIPEIYTAIQCKGFTPSQRAVYDRFKSVGYPTDPAERVAFLRMGSPTEEHDIDGLRAQEVPTPVSPSYDPVGGLRRAPSVPLSDQVSPALQQKIYQSGLGSPTRASTKSDIVIGVTEVAPLDYLRRTPTDCEKGSQNLVIDKTRKVQGLAEIKKEGQLLEDPSPEWKPNIKIQPGTQAAAAVLMHSPLQGSKGQKSLSKSERDLLLVSNLQKFGLLPDPVTKRPRKTESTRLGAHGEPAPTHALKVLGQVGVCADHFKHDSRASRGATGCTGPLGKVCSLFKAKSGPLQGPGKRLSQSTVTPRDSGYFSGRASPCTLPGTAEISPHPSSSTEFGGLHRVDCHTLHEPSPMYLHQFREVPTCSNCGYSGIHNLAWSARYLKLEVFQTELKLEAVYDFLTTDTAGNSALHYAAASGAGYSYLKALIDASVNPYQLNTANQSFLHWLRPCQPPIRDNMPSAVDASSGWEIGEPERLNLECFNLDVVNLLNLVQPRRLLTRQDNDGRTVLHALASHITEPELRARVFRFFKDAGCPTTAMDRFGRTARDVFPTDYRFVEENIVDLSTFNTSILVQDASAYHQGSGSAMAPEPAWSERQLKQMSAHNTIAAAQSDVHYVDEETGDGILNALARVSPYNYRILEVLQHFAAKGADLNLHNREGNHPLASFTSKRPFETETGATKAKYLEVLLWKKGHKYRMCNEINVNMKNRAGATALHNAAVRGEIDSVRSLIDAGANVNARLDCHGDRLSVLRATRNARDEAVLNNNTVQHRFFTEVISHLEHAGAVEDPTSSQERGFKGILASR